MGPASRKHLSFNFAALLHPDGTAVAGYTNPLELWVIGSAALQIVCHWQTRFAIIYIAIQDHFTRATAETPYICLNRCT